MFNDAINVAMNLLSAVQFLDKNEELQRDILTIVRDEINRILEPKPQIDTVRFLYETEGKVSAIKRWKTINEGMGLKDAKDQIEKEASRCHWKHCKVGKRCTINYRESSWDSKVGIIDRVIDNGGGYYVRFPDFNNTVFFHQSAVDIDM